MGVSSGALILLALFACALRTRTQPQDAEVDGLLGGLADLLDGKQNLTTSRAPASAPATTNEVAQFEGFVDGLEGVVKENDIAAGSPAAAEQLAEMSQFMGTVKDALEGTVDLSSMGVPGPETSEGNSEIRGFIGDFQGVIDGDTGAMAPAWAPGAVEVSGFVGDLQVAVGGAAAGAPEADGTVYEEVFGGFKGADQGMAPAGPPGAAKEGGGRMGGFFSGFGISSEDEAAAGDEENAGRIGGFLSGLRGIFSGAPASPPEDEKAQA